MTLIGSLYGLSKDFFDTACLVGDTAPPEPSQQAPQQLPPPAGRSEPAGTGAGAAASGGWREGGATCLTCGIGVGGPGFASPQEQREHFKTDWHRYNVKRRLARQPAVSEEAFERVLEQGTELSISGSESESGTEEEEEEDEGGAAEGAQGGAGRRRGGNQDAASAVPRVTFQAADGTPFSVWRCLLRQDHVRAPQGQPTSPGELLGELRRLRTGCGSWAVVLLRGGHFAATVFKAREGRAANVAKHDADGLEGFDVVAHKTFHRYVVRAKAGGKQSSKDATGKFARSAGSRLRRYNEQALERDVAELLASWAPHIAAADLLFVHAPASNSRSLFTAAQTTLLPSDPRTRRVPFVTRRPTFSETKRVLRLLCAVFRPEAAEQLLRERGEAAAEEEEQAAAAAAEAMAAASLGADKPPAAAAGPSASPAVPAAPDAAADDDKGQERDRERDKDRDTPLHRAARANDAERVRRLLEGGHDPCARDAKGRAPYALAAERETRDAFRRFMAQQPDRWDYAATGIPSPLTEEMEAAQLAKKAAHKAKLKAKDAERKAKAEGPGAGAGPGPGTASAEERRRAAEAEARKAMEDEIAQAAAEAAAIAARLNASAKAPPSKASGAGGKKVKAGAKAGAAGPAGGGGGGGAVGPGELLRRHWPVLLLGGLFALTALAERRRR